MRPFASLVSPRSFLSCASHFVLVSGAVGLLSFGALACAEDEQPLTGSLGATPAGGGAAGAGGQGQAGALGGRAGETSGGSAGTSGGGLAGGFAGSSTGGKGGAAATGGTGGASAGGAGSGGEGGTLGHVTCKTPNPAGCIESGCGTGEICAQVFDVCRPSGCACDDTGQWSCTPDCGGGVCVPSGAVDASHFVRLGLQVGQQNLQELCVAYTLDAKGFPVFAPDGLLGPAFLSAGDFSSPSGPQSLEKISRYLPLTAAPVAFGLSSSTSCADVATSVLAPASGSYFTVFSMPYSGEAPQTWVLTDHGIDAAPPEPPSVRVVNALYESRPVVARVYDAVGSLELGSLEFGNSPDYIPLPVGGAVGSNLHGLSLTLEDGTKAALLFTSMDLLSVTRHTIFLRGSEQKIEGIVCNDARADQGFYGGAVLDGRFSGCITVPASYAD